MSRIDDYLDDGTLRYAGWTRALRDGTLLGQRCADCGATTATPKAACVRCGGRALAVEELPREGSVMSVTTIGVAPEGVEPGYDVAVIDLGPARILGRISEHVRMDEEVALSGTIETDRGPAPLFDPID